MVVNEIPFFVNHTLNTFVVMEKNHRDNERGNPPMPLHGILFSN